MALPIGTTSNKEILITFLIQFMSFIWAVASRINSETETSKLLKSLLLSNKNLSFCSFAYICHLRKLQMLVCEIVTSFTWLLSHVYVESRKVRYLTWWVILQNKERDWRFYRDATCNKNLYIVARMTKSSTLKSFDHHSMKFYQTLKSEPK